MTMINRDEAVKLLETTGDKFFNVVFLKKDGSTRSMTARYGVTKGVLGDAASEQGKKALATWRENNPNLIRLFDIHKDAFRTVNLDTILSLKIGGEEFTVR
jgi:hypothetical protein